MIRKHDTEQPVVFRKLVHCPTCGCTKYAKRNTYRPTGVGDVVMCYCRCKACGAKFKLHLDDIGDGEF